MSPLLISSQASASAKSKRLWFDLMKHWPLESSRALSCPRTKAGSKWRSSSDTLMTQTGKASARDIARNTLKRGFYTYFHHGTYAEARTAVLWPVSGRILSLEMDLRSLITLVTIVFSMLKITRGLEVFWETGTWFSVRETRGWGGVGWG